MKPVLSVENQTATLPLSLAISIWLLMQHFNVAQVWYGVYWTISTIWGIYIVITIIMSVAKGRKTFTVGEDGKIRIK